MWSAVRGRYGRPGRLAGAAAVLALVLTCSGILGHAIHVVGHNGAKPLFILNHSLSFFVGCLKWRSVRRRENACRRAHFRALPGRGIPLQQAVEI
ncbi:hypothetical protein Bpro_5009 (plasmid) [Polaromonas sp. JS666]|nr:hypothetical protein Bpro_5009 [Polaromonas sp. JS666]